MIRILPIVLLMGLAACAEPQIEASGGEAVYAATCAACHAPDGRGVNEAFPPLVDSPWVALPDSLLIRLALRGLRGEIRVGDRTYNNVMPPHAFLTDQQLADVLTFVRAEFAALDRPVQPGQVARERVAFGEGPMWTIGQLTARGGQ